PWGVLILFGGGLSLARGMKETGVTSCLAHAVGGSAALPTPVLVLLVTTLIVFLTELTSNTATTAAFLPVLAAVGEGLHLPPLILTVPAAVGASLAFMMPVATPPNAIVFSTGRVTIPQMCKAGFWLNLIGIAVVMTLVYGWILPLGLAE
ncbi:MAG: SLC13 family permease, partial [Planctomycetota bacterium]